MRAPAEAKPGSVLEAVLRACKLWKLSTAQECQLFGVERQTLWRWSKTPPALTSLPGHTVERISYVLGIFKALQILLPDPALADDWIHRPNSAAPFNGQRPLDRMLAGNTADLYVVRRYLDGERGW